MYIGSVLRSLRGRLKSKGFELISGPSLLYEVWDIGRKIKGVKISMRRD